MSFSLTLAFYPDKNDIAGSFRRLKKVVLANLEKVFDFKVTFSSSFN
jgi:hypothetical protein